MNKISEKVVVHFLMKFGGWVMLAPGTNQLDFEQFCPSVCNNFAEPYILNEQAYKDDIQ